MSSRLRIIGGVAVLALIGVGVWLWLTRGRESTDDAQVDAYVTPIASRVGGTIQRVAVNDNQQVEAGAVLVEIDPRDYEVALERARAELANAQAESAAAQANVPISSTETENTVAAARGGVDRAAAGIVEAQHGLDASKAHLSTAQARKRELDATAAKDAKDVERLKGLLAKDEIPQQQFDTALAQAESSRAAADSAGAQVLEAEAAIKAADSRLVSAHGGEAVAAAELRRSQTAPEQMAVTRARAASAAARVKQAEASVKQAELNLEYTTIKAPFKGTVSRKTVQPGQVVQPGQPLMAIIALEQIWITANFKETQLENMRPGQRVSIDVDAYGGKHFTGKIETIAPATGARFSLLPPENASGNFVKVVQRVPVKIVLDAGQDPDRLLRPGMSVTPTVYTR
ncbi:MAG TPA: HlyD family secretion protein [Vicinamibacterales bacterium]|jgi:membrane fusion protein (multidrug efflux system)